MEYEKLYAQMVEAAEQAITAIFGEFVCTERLPRRGFAEKRLIRRAWP